jgi:hypothetical protein
MTQDRNVRFGYMNAGIKLATKAEGANADQKPVVLDRLGNVSA